ncbi:MAG: hypothetical protein FWB96_12935 [Defluviitaleaceae bacterium]|nr:hypothetical protein [Defluviitaleaceae bacterium]MCL2264212.1 hypothetical protein [Defluviitaleaceae bacterium]
MAQSVTCAGCRVQLDVKQDLICPNCNGNNIFQTTSLDGATVPAHFHCYSCKENWRTLPCPKCGTGILASTVKGCYVATCVYGSYDCPEVWTLRRYRDNVLAKSLPGRMFTRTYYAASPKLVRWFGDKAWFKRICKPCTDALVARLKKRGIDDSPYSDKD